MKITPFVKAKLLGYGILLPLHGFEEFAQNVEVDPVVLFAEIVDDLFLGEVAAVVQVHQFKFVLYLLEAVWGREAGYIWGRAGAGRQIAWSRSYRGWIGRGCGRQFVVGITCVNKKYER